MDFLKLNIPKWVIYVIIVIIIYIITLYFFFISPIDKELSSTMFLGKPMQDLGAMISSLALIIALVLSGREYINNKTARSQEKSAEIAKLFSEEVTFKLTIVTNVIFYSKLGNIISSTKKSKDELDEFYLQCSNFDIQEIIQIYGPDISEIYNKIMKSQNMQKVYYKVFKLFTDPDYCQETFKEDISKINAEYDIINNKIKNHETTNKKNKSAIKNNTDKKDDTEIDFKYSNIILPKKISGLIQECLNQLEYICMFISSQPDNSQFIYQSLHKVFLSNIRNLAITIGKQNNNSYDKLYTNIIEVYNTWAKKYKKDIIIEKKRKIKINKILNPKITKI